MHDPAEPRSRPFGLRLNGRHNPVCVESHPAFTWQSTAARQRAFQIQVGDRPGEWEVWDSGEITTAGSVRLAYGGRRLQSQTPYFWRVRVWDETGARSDWSETATWTTGLTAGEADWSGAKWIGGPLSGGHDWYDAAVSVKFAGTRADPQTGLALLLRAESYSKVWGEAMCWSIQLRGAGPRLVMKTKRDGGQPWVDDGTSAPAWGIDRHDPQSHTNPTESWPDFVEIGDVAIPAESGLTTDNWEADHELEVDLSGLDVTTRVNGVTVDRRRLSDRQIRRHGTVGFAAGTSAIVQALRVTDRADPRKSVDHDLRFGANPFESGIGTAGGVTFLGRTAVLPPGEAAPLVRTAFELPAGEVERALLHVSVAGFAELTVNGERLTTDGRSPREDQSNIPRMLMDQSTYDRTVLYEGFDVTRSIRAGGTNVLAAELGRGWYGVSTPTEWYWHRAPYVGAPRLKAKLAVRYADGRVIDVVSDDSWETAAGPTSFDSVYSGEKYDARRAEQLGDWRRGSATAVVDEWAPASVVLEPGSCSAVEPLHHGRLPSQTRPEGFVPARLKAHEGEPVCVVETLAPRSWTETAPGTGVYLADFGQIVTGFTALHLSEVAPDACGWTIRMRGSNAITGEGTAESPIVLEEENFFHDADLQVNYFTVGAETDQEWEARFNNWGVRYVEVRNLEPVLGRAPALESDPDLLLIRVARTAFKRTASISTDNPLIERIISNLEWAQQNNNVGKPTDTPSREKNGWTGDTMADSEAQCIVWDLQAQLTRYVRGFPDGQITTGQLPMILPAAKGGYGYDRTPGWAATWKAVPAWDSAFFVIPWELWTYYGSSAVFAELYEHQDRLLLHYETLFTPENGYRFDAALGAYSGAEEGGFDHSAISLQCYIYAADYMDRVGRTIGEHERAAYYAGRAADLRRAFIAAYWDRSAGHYVGGSISSQNALAVAWEIVPGSDLPADHPLHVSSGPTQQENRAGLVKVLADRIVQADNHIVNDMFGSRYEFNLLSDGGFTDTVAEAITKPGYPGYVHQIAAGATSLWEGWDAGSLNHHYRSNVATWLYQSLAGIRPTSPGYSTVRIRPCVPRVAVTSQVPNSREQLDLRRSSLDRVEASVRTVRGEVTSRWHRIGDTALELEVAIPPNMGAEVWVPGSSSDVWAPSASHIGDGSVGDAPYTVFDVRPGAHAFRGRVPERH